MTTEWDYGIEGDKNLPMMFFDVTIVVEEGVFKEVIKNGSVISLAEHNQYYTDLPTITTDPKPNLIRNPIQPKPAPLPTPTPRR